MSLSAIIKRIFAISLLGFSTLVWASPDSAQISASEAQTLFSQGEVTLIDIRRPQEWRQTGVATGAVRIDMVHPEGLQGFAQEVFDTVGGDLDAPIVLICRTGSRTSRLQPVLTQAGFTNVRHVPEGMLGKRGQPGWIAQGLPVDPCTDC